MAGVLPHPGDLWHRTRERFLSAPDAPAFVAPTGEVVSAGEVLARIESAREALEVAGVRPGHVVAQVLPRGSDAVVAMFAIWHVGAVYVPLSADAPPERLRLACRELGAAHLVTSARAQIEVPTGVARVTLAADSCAPRSSEPVRMPPAAPAYVLYTSGSTGTPKGVVVSRGALAEFTRSIGVRYGMGAGKRLLQFSEMTFDVSIEEVAAALPTGGALTSFDESMLDPEVFFRRITSDDVNVLALPSSFFAELAGYLERTRCEVPPSLERVLVGGERVDPAAVRRMHAASRQRVAVVNSYGPTETTATILFADLSPEDAARDELPIGAPLPHASAHVTDARGALVPPESEGELLLGGASLATGYWGDPRKTAASFLPDPFSSAPGARLYRTGDRVRRDADGRLTFLGRLDEQLKVRGYRIEPAEVEAAICTHPAVAGAAVALDSEHQRLVAFWTAASGDGALPDASQLAEHLRAHLPPYMIPAAFQRLERLPVTSSGKVDRKALPAASPPQRSVLGDRSLDALAGLWFEVLGAGPVSPKDSFAALGGHSLAAMRLCALIRERMARDVRLLEVMQASTLEAMAALIAAAPPAEHEVEGAIYADPRPLTHAQQELWMASQLGANVNISLLGAIEGEVSHASVTRASELLTELHPALRTRLLLDSGVPKQIIERERAVGVDVDWHTVRRAHVSSAALKEAAEPFDHERGPLFRVRVLDSGDVRWLLFTMSHLVGDERALEVCLADLLSILATGGRSLPREVTRARRPAPPEPPTAAYVAQVRDAPRAIPLGALAPDASAGAAVGRSLAFRLDRAQSRAIDAASRAGGVSPFAVCMAAWAATLARLTGERSVVFGVPVSSRRPVDDDVVGLYVNTLPVVFHITEGANGANVLEAAVGWQRTLLENAQVTPQTLVDAWARGEGHSDARLFNTMFVFNAAHSLSRASTGLSVGLDHIDEVRSRGAIFDLELAIWPTGDGYAGVLDYRSDRVDPFHAGRLVRDFTRALVELAGDSARSASRWPSLSREDEEWIARHSGSAGARAVAKHVHVQLLEQAARAPERDAVIAAEDRASYRTLSASALALAATLQERGLAPGEPVLVMAGHSVTQIIGAVGVLCAGGVYLPADAKIPAERLASVASDAAIRFAIVEPDAHLSVCPEGVVRISCPRVDEAPREAPVAVPPLSASAYLMFTSGSTGKPKGVVVPHGAIASEIAAVNAQYYRVEPGTVVQQFTSMGFDVSLEEIWVTLAYGGTLVMREERMFDPAVFLRAARDRHVEVASVPTSFFVELATHVRAHGVPNDCPLRRVVVGGERMLQVHAQNWVDAVGERITLVNAYGPTETTCGSTGVLLTPATLDPRWRELPIGTPFNSATTHVVDASLDLVPPGVTGELLIGGPAVASGYLGRPRETASAFVPDRWAAEPGCRAYRTGDLVRQRVDGQLEFLGRRDRQVKIRALRIELGEIERVLLADEAVASALVVVRKDKAQSPQLVAYLVPNSGSRIDVAAIRVAAAAKLPDYMVPSALVAIDAFPLTINGKIDEAKLPAPPEAERSEGAPLETDTERAIAALWRELLAVDVVWADDDFFALGGHSLLIVRLVSRIREALGVEISIALAHRTSGLRALAALIDERAAAGAAEALSPLPAVVGTGPHPIGLFQLPQLGFARRASTNAWTTPVALRVRGASLDALIEAFRRLATIHRVVRARIDDDAEHPRVWLDAPLAVRVADGDGRGGVAEIDAFVARACDAPFDLAAGGLVRLDILPVGHEDHAVVLAAHHFIASDRSMDILFADWMRCVNDVRRRTQSPDAPLNDYLSFCAAQRQRIETAEVQRALAAAKERLANATLAAIPELLTMVGPAAGCQFSHAVDYGSRLAAIDALRAGTRASRNAVMLSAIANAIPRQHEDRPLVLMMVNTTARFDYAGLERTVGLYANHHFVCVPPRLHKTAREYIGAVQEAAVDAAEHNLPSALVLDTIDVLAHPYSHVLLNARPLAGDEAPPRIDGLELSELPIHDDHWHAKAPLSIQLLSNDDGMILDIHAPDDLFSRARVAELAQSISESLDALLS